MKILYIGLKYDYGVPERGHSYEHSHFYGSLTRLHGGSHDVIYFAFDEVMREVGREEMNKKLLHAVNEHEPDLCFFALFTDEIKKSTIRKITDSGKTVTYNWFADDHWRFNNYSRHWAPLFNWVSTTDSKAPAKYEKIGYKNVLKTQWACNNYVFRKTGTGIKHDVTFVGQTHSDREEVVSTIRKAGINIECWGAGWPNGRISHDDMIKMFSESKINLNFTKSSGTLRIKPIAKIFLNRRADDSYQLVSPFLWWANMRALLVDKRREQIKGRNFEIPGSGGFLLTGMADNLGDYYEDGKEIVIFRDTKDLIDKAKYYLKHEDERVAIAEAGYERTLREHTYEARFGDIFKTMGLEK